MKSQILNCLVEGKKKGVWKSLEQKKLEAKTSSNSMYAMKKNNENDNEKIAQCTLNVTPQPP